MLGPLIIATVIFLAGCFCGSWFGYRTGWHAANGRDRYGRSGGG